jgi:CheY-like chemotaxis protein
VNDNDVTRIEICASPKIRHDTVSAKHILVADDSSYLRKLCVDVLVDAGYEVTPVADGAEAWEALQAYGYDLVITDNKMPRLSGLEMIEKIRAACLLLPVIMATGFLPAAAFVSRPWLRPDALLERPFSNELLLETVKKVLRKNDDYNAHLKILL